MSVGQIQLYLLQQCKLEDKKLREAREGKLEGVAGRARSVLGTAASYGELPNGSAITVGDERGCTGNKAAGGPAV